MSLRLAPPACSSKAVSGFSLSLLLRFCFLRYQARACSHGFTVSPSCVFHSPCSNFIPFSYQSSLAFLLFSPVFRIITSFSLEDPPAFGPPCSSLGGCSIVLSRDLRDRPFFSFHLASFPLIAPVLAAQMMAAVAFLFSRSTPSQKPSYPFCNIPLPSSVEGRSP